MSDKDKKMQWFREARFGMFIHWGLYAVPAGEWNGKTNHGEWIQCTAGIPCSEYDKLAAKFNPVKFDADDWTALARAAGMKYMVFTTKHHEGFCMFDTAHTDFNIVKGTPFKRDTTKELADACKQGGVRFCTYHSVADWHHPEYPTLYTHMAKEYPDGFHGNPNPDADALKYLDYMKEQVRELLTNYGPIGIMWFDCWFMTEREKAKAQEIADMIHELQPDCLINPRLGGAGSDFNTPEQHIPGTASGDFEVCMTLNNHWGYCRADNNWKDAKTVIQNLATIVSKGGNYLLNVGPTTEGTIPEESVRILKEVGEWIKVNGEAIYAAGGGAPAQWAAPFVMTAKPGAYYLFVFKWPDDGRIFVGNLTSKLKSVYFLADRNKAPLKVDTYRKSMMIHLPEKTPDDLCPVIKLEIG